MAHDGSDLERRLTEIQSQINRLSLSMHLWRERQDRLAPMEARLSQLAEQCADLVGRWAATGERQVHAVETLEQRVSALDAGAQADAAQQLRDQAAALADSALAMASTIAASHDRTASRLTAIEGDLRHGLADLSGQVQTAVAELRGLAKRTDQKSDPGPHAQPASWPLDGVVRLHNQLRDVATGASATDMPLASTLARLQLPEPASDLADRVESLERAVSEQQGGESTDRRLRLVAWATAALLVVALAGAGYVVVLQRQVQATTARMSESQRLAEAATQAANRQIAAAREDAARQIAEARETAFKAQTISDVLAAPDLVRYNLVGRPEGRNQPVPSTAQALFSRSRGLVFSGSRLPPPPVDSAYQIWLLGSDDPVSAGTFVPDAGGRFTMATNTPPAVSAPLAGISVTVERFGGSDRPTGAIVLARASGGR